jgi:hypothetical protein
MPARRCAHHQHVATSPVTVRLDARDAVLARVFAMARGESLNAYLARAVSIQVRADLNLMETQQ